MQFWGDFWETFVEGFVHHIMYKDCALNRSSFIFCRLACAGVPSQCVAEETNCRGREGTWVVPADGESDPLSCDRSYYRLTGWLTDGLK